jgi:hypothetical protein
MTQMEVLLESHAYGGPAWMVDKVSAEIGLEAGLEAGRVRGRVRVRVRGRGRVSVRVWGLFFPVARWYI